MQRSCFFIINAFLIFILIETIYALPFAQEQQAEPPQSQKNVQSAQAGLELAKGILSVISNSIGQFGQINAGSP